RLRRCRGRRPVEGEAHLAGEVGDRAGGAADGLGDLVAALVLGVQFADAGALGVGDRADVLRHGSPPGHAEGPAVGVTRPGPQIVRQKSGHRCLWTTPRNCSAISAPCSVGSFWLVDRWIVYSISFVRLSFLPSTSVLKLEHWLSPRLTALSPLPWTMSVSIASRSARYACLVVRSGSGGRPARSRMLSRASGEIAEGLELER